KLTFPNTTISLTLSSLLFGGAPATNGARELGITACLKNVYVDHHDIIYMMYDNDKRVESSKTLGPCNRDGSLPDLSTSGVPMFNADPLPNELSETLPLHHGITHVDDTPPQMEDELKNKISQSSYFHNFVADRNLTPLFKTIPEDPSNPVPCEKSQDYVCRNGATCERHSGKVICICKRGFGGKYCQFVLHPRTCAEANKFHGISSGPTQLDVDGSRSLFGSVAVCRDGTTIVPHDMPNATVIRSSDDPTDALFIVSYRDFTSEKLARFESKRTWFQVAVGNRTVRQIGRVPNSCPCMDLGCIENSAIAFKNKRVVDQSNSNENTAKLNDTKWHLLVLEIANDEIRLSVDGFTAFTAINETEIPSGQLQLNDDDNGFSGCIRSLIVNDEAVDVQAIGKDVAGVFLYCDDRCHENFCQNAAECVEDFAKDSAICRCRYPNVYSGRNCEIDINQNTSVSFHGGFLKYELPQNALVEQTVLSFRTDQSQALILFVHDHNNNFMQLHLSEEVNLTLSLNNDDIVSFCTVRAHDGTEFGNMEWMQDQFIVP
ncbi:EGF-like domain protein, partial [Teladorsagia circumcincta]